VTGIVSALVVMSGCGGHSSTASGKLPPSTSTTKASTSSTGVNPTTTVRPGTSTTEASCQQQAATNHYFAAASAQLQGNNVIVTGVPQRLVCGGADDSHYEPYPANASSQQLTLSGATSVSVLTQGSNGPVSTSISPSKLPSQLSADEWGNIFEIITTSAGVNSFLQVYTP
jgi:hypothetical protein